MSIKIIIHAMEEEAQVIFCDVDKMTKDFLIKNEAHKKFNYQIIEKSLNDLDRNALSKFSNAKVISCFVYSRLSGEILENFKNLKLIAVRSTGYNNVDLDHCAKRGIKVVNVLGYGEITVAEYAIGILLNLTRKIGFSNDKLRRGIVDVTNDMGIDLAEKTVGVIGTGAIGRHFVKLCHSFGCKVIAHDPFPNKEMIESGICEYVDINSLLENSDIINLSCPATRENYHFINKDTISKMKTGVFLINTARGELINPLDLYEAIMTGKIGGAGLDVLDYEDVIIKNELEFIKSKNENLALYSMINLKLLQLPNVIITPHIAFNSEDAVLRILDATLKTIPDFLAGKPVKSVI